MRISNSLALLIKTRILLKSYSVPFKFNFIKNYGINNVIKKQYFSTNSNNKYKSPIIDDQSDSDVEPDLEILENNNVELKQKYVRNLLYKNSSDLLINRIKDCASIQEVFNVFNYNLQQYKGEHILQSILVLYDLKNIFHDVNSGSTELSSSQISNEFIEQLNSSDTFNKLLKLVETKSNSFSTELLSYLVLYLNKLGLPIENALLQQLLQKLEKDLLENFSIASASRFLETIYGHIELRSYFKSQKIVPLVFDEINKCNSVSSLNDLTVSLNKLNLFLRNEQMEEYKKVVEKFIKEERITFQNYKVILNIISLLNYPRWRNENCVLISNCILLMKDHLNLLDVYELTVLYDIFYKSEQPGEILSELQRCTSRYLQQLEDIMLPQKITLFSSLIFFTSPNLRYQFKKSVNKYVEQSNNIENLLLLKRILSYIKTDDSKLFKLYWDKVLKVLKTDSARLVLPKIAQSYIHFNAENFRHKEFEQELCSVFEDVAMNNVEFYYFPHKLANILSFVIIYGKNATFLNYLIVKLEKNVQQLNHLDALKLSLALRVKDTLEKDYEKVTFTNRINTLIHKIIENYVDNPEFSSHENNSLLKASIFKINGNKKVIDRLLNNYKSITISSKSIESICYYFMFTNSLIPEVMDRIADYVAEHKDFVVGFNIEKILYMFYSLGYTPKNPAFFDVATNIIIRDQERIGGLSLIHCGMALCYFHKLPSYLIKSIFNVEFLDKLDLELENCYYKDKYPQRVRNNMMQLNRAVCLDYPESNVPWFHKKYIQELYSSTGSDKRNKLFPARVKEYLQFTLNDDNFFENFITPYGYKIDFVVYLNEREQVVYDEAEAHQKLAILLLPQYCYSRLKVQLRGKTQLKKRHLEILGYKVILINFSDWISLFHADERTDFLSRLIWPNIKVYR